MPYALPDGEKTVFDTRYYEFDGKSAHVVLSKNLQQPDIDLRLATSCSLAHQLQSIKCDCGTQMRMALTDLSKTDNGALMIYSIGEAHEGRGAGEINHVRAYILQHRERVSTVASYSKLGIPVDPRGYAEQAEIIRHLRLERKHFQLMTNNDNKVGQLKEVGLDVQKALFNAPVTPYNHGQLLSRQRELGHEFSTDLSSNVPSGAIRLRELNELDGVDFDVHPKALDPTGQRYGPFPLPYAIDGIDSGRIQELQTNYYVVEGNMYFAVWHPAAVADVSQAEVAALTACMPGHILGSTVCDCRRSMKEVMQSMQPNGKQPPVLIFSLGYYDKAASLKRRQVLAHGFNQQRSRKEISMDHPHAQVIMRDLGIRKPRAWQAPVGLGPKLKLA